MANEDVLEAVWRGLGGEVADLEAVTLTGVDPVLPSSFRVAAAAQASIASAALGAMAFDRHRSNRRQTLAVDARHAAIECRSERHCLIDGAPPADPWDDLAGAYPCGDGRIVRLHTNFPHHRQGIVDMLDGAATRADVGDALGCWDALAFEDTATARGLCVAAMRPFAEWDAHPQRAAIAASPLVRLARLGDAPPRRWTAATRPLERVRVVELTRIIAGPVAGRTLAAHGAEVLRLKAPQLPTIESLDVDTGRGKRSASLDLATAEGRAQLMALLGDAHVLLQSYRPGALDRFGLAAADLAERFPGLIVAELSAYGEAGPWRAKRGFDSLVQTATGLNVAEAEAAGSAPPRVLPLQLLDHASGHLLAAGIATALLRQATVGGTWRVAVSLARTGAWLRALGRVADGPAIDDPGAAVDELLEQCGTIRAVRHAAELSATPARWERAPEAYGASAPYWSAS